MATGKLNLTNEFKACLRAESCIEANDNSSMTSNQFIRISEELIDHEIEDRTRYIITYAILMAVAMYAYIHRTFAFFSMCLKASTTLHDKLFRGITRATMYFYNRNSSGRILNRFARDINNIDTSLPPSLIECISVRY